MLILVTYDVSTSSDGGAKRLRRIAKICLDYGQRVQFSVFELEVDAAKWTAIKQQLSDEMDSDVDSLRFYYLGLNWRGKVEHIGIKPALDLSGPLVF
jgi:CRISPR-associated protein Cas2